MLISLFYQRPGAGAKCVQSSSKTFAVSEVKLDSGLVHGAAQKSAALVCLIGIGKINLYNLHLSPCPLWLPVSMGWFGKVRAGQVLLMGSFAQWIGS